VYGSCFLTQTRLIIVRVSVALFSKICTKLDAVPLSVPSRNLIRPNTRLQIKGHKKSALHPAAWNFVNWLPRYASTIIYRCIALLQLLNRWQYQSRKLWIPHLNCYVRHTKWESPECSLLLNTVANLLFVLLSKIKVKLSLCLIN
jgi:hypothetical protein